MLPLVAVKLINFENVPPFWHDLVTGVAVINFFLKCPPHGLVTSQSEMSPAHALQCPATLNKITRVAVIN